ncbi:MAG: 5,6-dimethylbenzimidazole synthase [Pseudomonadales bacterium]
MTTFNTADSALVMQVMHARRDVRGNRFLDTPIPAHCLEKILDAALCAPSVGFSQPWKFVIVRDQRTKAAIKASFDTANAEASALFAERQQDYRALKLEGITRAPLNIAVFYTPSDRPVLGQTSMPETGRDSVACAIQNMWLMARSLNIGLGWVSILDPLEVKRLLKAPADSELVGYLCLGYVDYFYSQPELEKRQWAERKKRSQIIFDESF